MRFHNITVDDMKNGDGLRVVLWVAGCSHGCKGCHNPVTWDLEGGVQFTEESEKEIFDQLNKDYISGITFSGGDPYHINNRWGINNLIDRIKVNFPNKTIWLYTGYTWEEILAAEDLFYITSKVDVIVEGRFKQNLIDINYHWAGSINQRVIDVQKTLKENSNGRSIVLHQ